MCTHSQDQSYRNVVVAGRAGVPALPATRVADRFRDLLPRSGPGLRCQMISQTSPRIAMATKPRTVVITLHVFSPSATDRPRNLAAIQKPESLKIGRAHV